MMNKQQTFLKVLQRDAISVLGLEKFNELSMIDEYGEFIQRNKFTNHLVKKAIVFSNFLTRDNTWWEIPAPLRHRIIEPVLEACIEYDS